MTLRAEAGLELVDAAKELRSKNLQFVTNVEIGNITLGSAACCQTKGALDSGQVDSHVIEIKWVDPSGQLRDASITSNPDLLYRMRSSWMDGVQSSGAVSECWLGSEGFHCM